MIERIQALQRHFGVRPDGIVGPVFLTEVERLAGFAPTSALTVSRRAVEMIVRFEIGSEASYRLRLSAPYWPGGASGVTIGIGYDLGYHTRAEIYRDWGGHLDAEEYDELVPLFGLKGDPAKRHLDACPLLPRIPLEAAREVFYTADLPRWAAKTRRAMPGVELLPADAQGALLSLCFNRGTSMASTDRRREMRQIRDDLAPLAKTNPQLQALESTAATLRRIAGGILAMRRLWIGQRLGGLIARREAEAALVEGADREYVPGEVVAL